MESQNVIESQNGSSQSTGINYEHKEAESFKSKVTRYAMWALRVKKGSQMLDRVKNGGASIYEHPIPPKGFGKKYNLTSWQVEGRDVTSIAPKENKAKKHILFLHGGAYVFNSSKLHWNLVERLVNVTNCTVIAPDYPLAPSQTYIDTYRFMEQIYNKLASEVDPSDIIFMGDSAGGGLALGLAQKLKQDGLPQPGHIILLAPWLDVTCSNPEINDIEKEDVLLNAEHLKLAGQAYAKGGDISSYLVCPINGSVEGLGKISVFIGTYDILYADVKKFKTMCDEKGVAINYFVYPKMIHDWLIFGLAESERAIQQIKALI